MKMMLDGMDHLAVPHAHNVILIVAEALMVTARPSMSTSRKRSEMVVGTWRSSMQLTLRLVLVKVWEE